MTTEEILEKEGIAHYEKDIRLMTVKELKANFGAASSGKIIVSKVIKNIVWQVYEWILAGQEQVEGNLRTFWYLYIKPVMGKIGELDDPTDPYDTMIDAFIKLVQDYGLFKYRDFNFDDDNWENRRIGQVYPQIILFAEKTGYMKFLKEFYDTYSITVTALGGQPSLLSTEYTAFHISELIPLTTHFYLISVVDYDPSGSIIARTYRNQLHSQSILDISFVNLIIPANYTPEEIENYKYPLPTDQRSITINQKWIQEGGGINGEMYGLESDSMPRQRLKTLIKKEIEQIQAII
jgi:hypothetical protein